VKINRRVRYMFEAKNIDFFLCLLISVPILSIAPKSYATTETCQNAQNSVIIEILHSTGYKYPDIVPEGYNPLTLSSLKDGSFGWNFDITPLSVPKEEELWTEVRLRTLAQRIGKACQDINTVSFGQAGGNAQMWFNRDDDFIFPHSRFDDHAPGEH
jgi:hypothetical protein